MRTNVARNVPSAVGTVSGINELILQAIEAGRADRLTELTAPAAQRAVIDGSR